MSCLVVAIMRAYLPHQSIANASPISTATPSALVVASVRAPESSDGFGSLDWDRDESDVFRGFLVTGVSMSLPLPLPKLPLPLPLTSVIGAGLPAQVGPAAGAGATAGEAG